MFSMVSALRETGECIPTLNAKIMISKMPMAMLNWKATLYRLMKAAGLVGAGKGMPVAGTVERVRDVKKFITPFKRSAFMFM